jgi:site-specific recombinase XerD
MKNHLINVIITAMESVLSIAQLQILQDCLVSKLNGLEIVKEHAGELSTQKLDNDSLIRQFIATKRLENLSEQSIRQYVHSITKFFQSINKSYQEITPLDIKFYLSVYASSGVSHVTVNNEKRFLSAFFSWLAAEDYIPKNPVLNVKNIKCEEIQKTNLNDEDIECLRDACKTAKETAIIDTLASTGIRVSELVSLDRSNVDFQSSNILVYGAKTKSYRIVYLTPKARIHLEAYLKTRTDNSPALFIGDRGGRISSCRVEKVIQQLADKAKIGKHITVHTFRRYLASSMFRRGCDLYYVSKLLGHSSTATTEKHYLNINQGCIKAAHEQYAG